MWRQIHTFLVFFAGDALGSLGIRLVVQQSQWAVLEAALSGLLWVYGVRLAAQKGTTVAAIVGIVMGVELGILIPLRR